MDHAEGSKLRRSRSFRSSRQMECPAANLTESVYQFCRRLDGQTLSRIAQLR